MDYIYAGMWFLVAIILITRFRKESRIIYVLSGYFAVMGMWWLANTFVSADLLGGTYGWIFRGVSAVVIVILIIAYFREKQNKKDNSNE